MLDKGAIPSSGSRDLTVETAPKTDGQEASRGLAAVPYRPAEDRERVRGRIAQWLLFLLIGIVAVVIAGVVTGFLPIEHLEKIGAIILSPVVALLGAVMGFYFGEQSRHRDG